MNWGEIAEWAVNPIGKGIRTGVTAIDEDTGNKVGAFVDPLGTAAGAAARGKNPAEPFTDAANSLTGGDEVDAAQQALQEMYQQNIEMLQAYRPQAIAAREHGLGHTLGAYGPANEYLKRMHGEEFGLDLEQLGNPGISEYLGGNLGGGSRLPPAPYPLSSDRWERGAEPSPNGSPKFRRAPGK